MAFRLAIFIFLAAAPAVSHADELSECRRLAPKYSASVEVVLWDSTRVDLLNDAYAFEVDWSPNWAESIGQSLYYAQVTKRKPAVILLVRDRESEFRHIFRAQTVCAIAGIQLFIEQSDANRSS